MKGKVIRMIRFDNDYNTGTHPAILDALIFFRSTNINKESMQHS